MALRVAAVCLAAVAVGQDLFVTKDAVANDVSSFTIHIVHRPNDPKSVFAMNNLRVAFCKKFNISPCAPDASAKEDALHLVDNFVVSTPASLFHDVSSFLQQHRIARLNVPATVDLDLAVHPNTNKGAQSDYSLALWAGSRHPVDMNAIYREKDEWLAVPQNDLDALLQQQKVSELDDEDLWAYSCSYDAKGGSYTDLCSKGPYATNTTCRANPLGAHIHLYYYPNDADDTKAKAKFESLAQAAFPNLGAPTDLCHDNYGHEQPHNATCWLGGPTPGGGRRLQSGPPGGGSFVTSHFSIYIINEDFAKVVGWVLQNDVDEVLGKSLDYILHPIYGCNFADHQMWSLHKGDIPNNMAGIEEEAGWTGLGSSELDPFGSSVAGGKCGCSDPKASAFDLHLLYNPIDASSVSAKDSLKEKLVSKFPEVSFIEDVPHSFKDSSSPFLAGQAHYKISAANSALAIADWLALERGSIDVLLVPETCCGSLVDYTQHAMWAGRSWPLNTAALKDVAAPKKVSTSNENKFLRRMETVRDLAPKHDYVLYALYANVNSYQVLATQKFVSSLVSEFSLNGTSCTSSSAVEPSYGKLCMMQETTSPSSTDAMKTAYAALFVPKTSVSQVFSWALTHRGADMNGYQVDLLMVPLTGSPKADFNDNALHAGVPWQVNQPALQ